MCFHGPCEMVLPFFEGQGERHKAACHGGFGLSALQWGRLAKTALALHDSLRCRALVACVKTAPGSQPSGLRSILPPFGFPCIAGFFCPPRRSIPDFLQEVTTPTDQGVSGREAWGCMVA